MGKKIFKITCRFPNSITTVLWGQFVLEEDGRFKGYAHLSTGTDDRQEVSLMGVMAKADYNRLLPTDIAFLAFADKIMWFKAAKTKDGLLGTFSYFEPQPIPSFTQDGGGAVEIRLEECAFSFTGENTIQNIENGIFGRRLDLSAPISERRTIGEAALDLYHRTPEYIDIRKHNDSMQVKTDSPD